MGLFEFLVDVATAPVKIAIGTVEAAKEAVEDIIDDILE